MKRFAVIFDMDGVIFDTERLSQICWGEAAPRFGITDIDQTLPECTGVTETVVRGIFRRRYGEDFPYDAFRAECARVMWEKCPDGVLPMKDGARELLEQLRGLRVPVALATSTRRALVEEELAAAGIDSLFDYILCGDMVRVSKPAPDIFLQAAAGLNALPEECLVIEDSHNGIRAARAAGMFPVMVPDCMPVTDEMRALSGRILPTLREVGRLIGEILAAGSMPGRN